MRWLREVLARGFLFEANNEVYDKWHEAATDNLIHESYVQFCHKHGLRQNETRKTVVDLCESCGFAETQAHAALHVPKRCRDGFETITWNEMRKRGRKFGELGAARRRFAEFTRLTIEWGALPGELPEEDDDEPQARARR